MFKVPGGLNYGIFFFQMNSALLFVRRRRRPSPSPSRVFSRVHSVLLSQGASVQKYFTSSVIINKAKILITLIESHHETMKLF